MGAATLDAADRRGTKLNPSAKRIRTIGLPERVIRKINFRPHRRRESLNELGPFSRRLIQPRS